MKKMYLLALLLVLSSTAAAAGKTKLDRLLSADMIGLQRAYFEKIAGVAKRVSDKRRQYDIRGCLINIVEDTNKTILSIELENISERCTFDTANLFMQGPAHKLTFARLNDVNIGGGRKRSMPRVVRQCRAACLWTHGSDTACDDVDRIRCSGQQYRRFYACSRTTATAIRETFSGG